MSNASTKQVDGGSCGGVWPGHGSYGQYYRECHTVSDATNLSYRLCNLYLGSRCLFPGSGCGDPNCWLCQRSRWLNAGLSDSSGPVYRWFAPLCTGPDKGGTIRISCLTGHWRRCTSANGPGDRLPHLSTQRTCHSRRDHQHSHHVGPYLRSDNWWLLEYQL